MPAHEHPPRNRLPPHLELAPDVAGVPDLQYAGSDPLVRLDSYRERADDDIPEGGLLEALGEAEAADVCLAS